MSERLRKSIITRIRTDEEAKIEKIAIDGAKRQEVEEAYSEDAELLKERAIRIGSLLTAHSMRLKKRGLIASFIGREVPQTEPYAYKRRTREQTADNKILSDRTPRAHLTRELLKIGRHTTEIGIRTKPFNIARISSEEFSFNEGWQVGAGIKYSGPRSVRVSSDSPVRIWHSAQEMGTGEQETEIIFEVSRTTGTTFSFTDGLRDDLLLSQGKDAPMQALYIINRAIKIFED